MTRTPAVDLPAAEAARTAAAVKRAWRDGATPDAAAALTAHPFLLRFKSVVVELAYEEFCLREERGAAPDPTLFCRRIPAYRSSLFTVLRAHKLLADNPDLLAAGPAEWPAPGAEVGGLTVRAEMGRGTFARAYLAYDPQTDRNCVLKLSPTQGGEGRALGPLSHPHITDVYWAGRVGGLNAVCMPLLGAVTLEDVREDAFWKNGTRRTGDLFLDAAAAAAFAPAGGGRAVVRPGEPYPVAVAAVAARVADALAYLHGKGREHGDLKPSNVVLAPGGHPYLIDFNLAAPADGPPAGTGGTLPFLAPERLRAVAAGGAAGPDGGRADVYALGATVYSLLTGRVPWEPDPLLAPPTAAADLLERRAAEPAPGWPAGAAPAPLARVVDRCLAREPAARPAAAEVAAELSRWVADRRARRARRGWTGLTAVAVGAVVAAALVWGGTGRPDEPAPPAVSEQPPGGVEPDPLTAEEFIARGRQRAAEGRLEGAVADFEAAAALDPGPRPLALLAYAYTGKGNSQLAVDFGLAAVRSGSTSAAVYSNLGWAYLRRPVKDPAKELGPALEYLDEAVRIDPEFVPARFNRAQARYRATIGSDWRLPDLGCVDDLKVVMAAHPAAAEVYFQAARMCAASAHLDPDLKDEAVRHLEAAVRLGDDPTRYQHEPVLKTHLGGHPGFDRFASLPKPAGPARWVNLRVADPEGP